MRNALEDGRLRHGEGSGRSKAGRRSRLGASLLPIILLLAACGLFNPPPANVPPTAAFTVTPPSGPSPLTVVLDAGASSDSDGQVVAYAWSVTGPDADPTSATGKTATFELRADGIYTAALTVTDDDGATATRTKAIFVGQQNIPPTATFTATPGTGAAPLDVDVDATGSSDVDGTIVSYQWTTSSGDSASGETATFTFDQPGNHAIELTVTDDDGASDTTSTIVTVAFPGPTAGFRIDLLFADPAAFDSVEKQAFEDAAARWSEVITGDLQDTTLPAMDADFCAAMEPAVPSMPVDDLIIQVILTPIDGEFNVVASAGPCRIRTSGPNDGLPYYGVMLFDSADASRMASEGTLASTVLHEMGHVLGLGTLWQSNALLAWEPDADPCEVAVFTTAPNYLGSGGNGGYADAGGSGNVPVEDDGGVGTRCGHWDEGRLDTEIMTGWIEAAGTLMPLSRTTAGSLADMGYTIDASKTDAYSLPACAPNCTNLRAGDAGERLNEILIYPVDDARP